MRENSARSIHEVEEHAAFACIAMLRRVEAMCILGSLERTSRSSVQALVNLEPAPGAYYLTFLHFRIKKGLNIKLHDLFHDYHTLVRP